VHSWWLPWIEATSAAATPRSSTAPTRPVIADRRELAGVGGSAIVDGDHLYVAMNAGDLHVLSVAIHRRAPLYVPVGIRLRP